MSVLEQTKSKMAAAVEHLKQELKSLRTGRASPSIVEHVLVEIYGSQMKIKELATITTPEARQLLIAPFDPQTTGAISKGIEKANLNLQPIVDGHAVRINIPPMDEAVRKDMVKLGRKKVEEAKIGIREIRRKQNELIRKQKADGDIPEDVMKKWEKSVQEYTDSFCKEADDFMNAKEKEIMTV
jgi:ribosome recycling factor